LDSMLFKKKGEFLKVLDHILNRGANNCGGHCILVTVQNAFIRHFRAYSS